MPIRQEYASPANAFIQGRAARQQYDYNQNRNALADMELQNAPAEMQARNKLLDTQVQGAEQALGAEKAKFAYAKLKQAIDSGRPREFVLQNIPDLAAKLGESGVDLRMMDDQSAVQMIDGLARKYAGEAGIAPTPRLETIGDTSNPGNGILQRDPTTGALKQVVAPQKPDHFAEAEAGRNARAAQGGAQGAAVVTMTSEEIAAAGLPQGTVAQRNQHGKINVIKKPDASGGGVKLTEGDKRARIIYSSILNAENDISKMSGTDTSSGYNTVIGSNPLTRGMQTDDYRKYEAAGLRWAANLLYLKSGATATPEEIRSTWKQFFPQFGDGDTVKAQKEVSRIQEITAVADAFGLDKSKIPQPKQPQQNSQPAQGIDERGYASLPSGTQYRAPDGTLRTKR